MSDRWVSVSDFNVLRIYAEAQVNWNRCHYQILQNLNFERTDYYYSSKLISR